MGKKAFNDMPTSPKVPRVGKIPDLQGNNPIGSLLPQSLKDFLEGCLQNRRNFTIGLLVLPILFLMMGIGAYLYHDPEMNALILNTTQDMVEQAKAKLLDLFD